MTAYFGVPEYQTNLTLILFFIFYAVGLLVWGPLSDRLGRKRALLIGMTCYAVAGALCAVAGNIVQLMVFRVFQAIGAGAGGTTATAIVKDAYEGKKRERTLAVVQSITVLTPLVAPIVGGLILSFTSWRGTFVAQGIAGFVMLLGSLAFQETLEDKLVGNPLSSLKRLGVVLKHADFRLLLITFTLFSIAAMAFISSSSYIYEVRFGLSSQAYGYYYALFGLGIAIGSPVYLLTSRWLKRSTILTGCLVGLAISGLLVLFLGGMGPWHFILAFFPAAVALACARPPSIYLMLAQHDADAGSVSGLVLASHMVLGSVGTVMVSLEIWGRVEMVGALLLSTSLVCLLLWLGVARQRVGAKGLS